MYRSALVALKPEGPNKELLEFAVDLARRNSLRLSGIAILDQDLVVPPEAVPLGGMAFKLERDERRIALAKQQMAAAIDTFNQHCQGAKIDFDSNCMSDHLCPQISRAVQRHDLLLVGHSAGTVASGQLHEHSVLHDLLRSCPRPALVVPARPDPEARSVVVAYDGSLQAARAVESFVASGFEVNSPIRVVSFDDNVAAAEAAAGLARDYLASHGYQVQAVAWPVPAGETVAGLIMSACQTHRARMLVMGTHGKTAIREFFFGSVTKKLLAQAELPVFLDR